MSVLAVVLMFLFPPCVEEDGSTQSACVWIDDSATVLNLDHGRVWFTLR